jgi:hypothetical protein
MKLRKRVKGWSINIEAEKKRKVEIISELDRLVEESTLSKIRSLKRQELRKELENIWLIEEIRARQRERDRDVKEGYRNTSYFFALANQRKRKNCHNNMLWLTSLEEDGVTYSDNNSMLAHSMCYYKKLFAREDRSNVKL